MRIFLFSLLTLFFIGIAVVGGGILYSSHYFEAPGPLAAQKIVVIPPGTSFRAVATKLEAEGVIKYPKLFTLLVFLRNEQGKLKAGEYQFEAGISPHGAETKMVDGKAIIHSVTVPEGLTVADAVVILQREPALAGDIKALPPEGSLMPETYFFLRGDTRAVVLKRMQDKGRQALTEAWSKRVEGLPYQTPEEALTLSSIVEKETGKVEERPQIAEVFLNRLRKGIPLQSDPTTIYGLYKETGAMRLTLSHADLEHPTPYNTYTIAGLPPAPICNPGKAAIEAVLHPATSEALYFVADGTGGHRFAKTLEEHNRNVAYYRSLPPHVSAPAH